MKNVEAGPTLLQHLRVKPQSAEMALTEVAAEPMFLLRCRPEDESLAKRIQSSGLISPLFCVKESSGRYQVVSGYRRHAAACRLGWDTIPIFFVAHDTFSPKELFVIALLLQEPATLAEMDKAVIVAKALDHLGFSWDVVLGLADLLGLPSSRAVLEDYAAVGRLPDAMWKLVETGRLPFKAARGLIYLAPGDQATLVQEVFEKCDFTTSEAVEIVEWLSDLTKKNRASLRALLALPPYAPCLGEGQLTRRERGSRFHQCVRDQRLPLSTARHERFRKIQQRLEAAEGIRLEIPPSCEQGGITLHLKMDSLDRWRSLRDYLIRHEELFKNLFDLVK